MARPNITSGSNSTLAAMARPGNSTVKFLSYNSTGIGPVQTQWIRDLMHTTGANFVGLQEHFKNIKSLQRFFKTEFTNFDSFVLPAHREEGRDTGRAKGGLAQLSLKQVGGVRREKVGSSGWRLQAQILHFEEFRLLWVNVYFPTDPRVVNFDEAELLVVQNELEAILDKGGYDGCLCGGDWNYDARRNSGFVKSMTNFLERVGLVSVWEKFEVDFTYMHTDHKSTSILDNYFVNEALLPYVVDAGPMHLGDNPSGHSPILLSLKVTGIPSRRKEEEVRVPRRINWAKVESPQLREYKDDLQHRLENLEEPDCLTCKDVKCKDEQHSKSRDSYVLDVMGAWIEAGHGSLPTTQQPGQKPQGEQQQKKRLPGWETDCEPLCKDSKFWYSVWLSAGRPAGGQLHRVMVSTRVKFRAAVRRARSKANSARAHVLLDAAARGDQALMQEMRKVLGSKHQPQEVPDVLEGEAGPGPVLEKFRSLYAALYNSAGSPAKMLELGELMERMIDCRSEGEVRRVTAEEVAAACRKMKGGKIDVSQGYMSDVFRHAPPLLCQKLAVIFRSFLTHGTITPSILACSFMPLIKSSKKDPTQFDSYRAVAGASQVLKLFEYVLLNIWGDHLQSDSLQFGFKPGTGTDQCSWLVHAVAEHYMLRGSPTLCCLLDVRKGFPSVRFRDLFEICLKKNLPVVVCRVLAYMYTEQTGVIKLGQRRSLPFTLSNGLREGAACSPILWAVYADGLLVILRDSGLGCHVAGVWVGGVLYADDLTLLAPSRLALAKMLSLVEAYGASLNLTFSSNQEASKCKSFCIYFVGPVSPRKIVYPAPLVLNGITLPWRKSAVHLGHTLHQDLTFDDDAKVRRAGFIGRSLQVRSQFGFAAPPQILTAVRLLCCHAYGSVLWRLESQAATAFFNSYSSCIRRLYRLPLNTFSYLVEGHLSSGLAPLRNLVLARVPTFFQRLLTSPSREVAIMANMSSGDARTITASNLRMMNNVTGLDCTVADKISVKNALPIKQVPEGEKWRLGLLDHLLELRSQLEKEGSDVKRVVAMLSSLCTT